MKVVFRRANCTRHRLIRRLSSDKILLLFRLNRLRRPDTQCLAPCSLHLAPNRQRDQRPNVVVEVWKRSFRGQEREQISPKMSSPKRVRARIVDPALLESVPISKRDHDRQKQGYCTASPCIRQGGCNNKMRGVFGATEWLTMRSLTQRVSATILHSSTSQSLNPSHFICLSMLSKSTRAFLGSGVARTKKKPQDSCQLVPRIASEPAANLRGRPTGRRRRFNEKLSSLSQPPTLLPFVQHHRVGRSSGLFSAAIAVVDFHFRHCLSL